MISFPSLILSSRAYQIYNACIISVASISIHLPSYNHCSFYQPIIEFNSDQEMKFYKKFKEAANN